MTLEMYGRKNSSTIWDGIVSLYHAGSGFIAFVVLFASVVIPILKMIIIFYLSLCARSGPWNQRQLQIYKFLELIGRWSMLDIFLVAVMVGIIKLGHWASVTAEPGSIFFALIVIFTMIASQSLEKYSHQKLVA